MFSLYSPSWRRFAAGKRLWTFSSVTWVYLKSCNMTYFLHLNQGSVDIVNKCLEGLRVKSLQGHPAALPLCEAGEHGVEVGRAGGQHHLVGGHLEKVSSLSISGKWILDSHLQVLCYKGDVAEKACLPHCLHALDHLRRQFSSWFTN